MRAKERLYRDHILALVGLYLLSRTLNHNLNVLNLWIVLFNTTPVVDTKSMQYSLKIEGSSFGLVSAMSHLLVHDAFALALTHFVPLFH